MTAGPVPSAEPATTPEAESDAAGAARRRSRNRYGRYVALLACLWCIPVVAVLVLQSPVSQSEASVLDGAAIETVPVGERVHSMRTNVRAEFTLADPSTVSASGGGLVTVVYVAPETRITPGALLAEVDGVGVLANRDARPYYRELSLGAQGTDVAQLNAFLQALGLPAPSDGERFTATSARGVKALQQQLGAYADGVFRPQYTWFVPPGFGVVGDVMIQVGGVLTPGDQALVAEQPAESAVILFENTEGAEELLSLGERAVDLVVGGVSLSLQGLTLQGSDAEDLRQQIAAAGGGVQSDPDARAESFPGLVLELRDPPTFGVVPRSALYTSDSGTVCLFSAPVPGSVQGAQAVALADGAGTGFEVTSALVPADLIGTDVVVNPTHLPSEVQALCT